MKARLATLGTGVAVLRTSAIAPITRTDPELSTKEHRVWRARVIGRAGGRCEFVVKGLRCERAKPDWQVYAHHIDERSDGGALYDLANGMCLCAHHHTLLTNDARARRHQS